MSSWDNAGKLTPERVAAFKAVMNNGKTLVEHQKEFNEVTAATLSDIRNGRSWRDVQPEQTKRKL